MNMCRRLTSLDLIAWLFCFLNVLIGFGDEKSKKKVKVKVNLSRLLKCILIAALEQSRSPTFLWTDSHSATVCRMHLLFKIFFLFDNIIRLYFISCNSVFINWLGKNIKAVGAVKLQTLWYPKFCQEFIVKIKAIFSRLWCSFHEEFKLKQEINQFFVSFWSDHSNHFK